MGLVTLDPASDYMRLIAPVLKSKLTLASDAWMQWLPTKTVHQRIRSLSAFLYNAMADSSISASDLTRLLADTVLSGSVATLLQPAYAARFKGMSETDIDDVLQSFALSKCRPNQALVDTLKKHLARHTRHDLSGLIERSFVQFNNVHPAFPLFRVMYVQT